MAVNFDKLQSIDTSLEECVGCGFCCGRGNTIVRLLPGEAKYLVSKGFCTMSEIEKDIEKHSRQVYICNKKEYCGKDDVRPMECKVFPLYFMQSLLHIDSLCPAKRFTREEISKIQCLCKELVKEGVDIFKDIYA